MISGGGRGSRGGEGVSFHLCTQTDTSALVHIYSHVRRIPHVLNMHIPRSVCTVSGEMPSSKKTVELMSPAAVSEFLTTSASGEPAEMQKRGASRADWGVKPRSMLRRTWTWPWGYRGVLSSEGMGLWEGDVPACSRP